MVTGNGADRTAEVNDFRGREIRRKRRKHAAASHRELHIPKTQKGMPAEKNTVGLNRRDGACGIDGRITLYQHHSRHVAGSELLVVGPGRGGAALCCDKSVILQLWRELLKR